MPNIKKPMQKNPTNTKYSTAQGKKMHQLSLSIDASFDKMYKKFEKKGISSEDMIFWQNKFAEVTNHIYELTKELNEEININMALPSIK